MSKTEDWCVWKDYDFALLHAHVSRERPVVKLLFPAPDPAMQPCPDEAWPQGCVRHLQTRNSSAQISPIFSRMGHALTWLARLQADPGSRSLQEGTQGLLHLSSVAI